MNQYLTKREQQILDYITRQIDHTGIAPSIQEIATEFEIPSLIRVTRYLNGLEGKGWIFCNSDQPGGITLIENVRNYRLSVCGDVEEDRVAFKKQL
ncbi:LexA repressor [Gimesia alba]|uniref:LexA repressor n=1 Tax=Gimesia alba TaxID=2527973 RepID=A0A517RH04_9PLAN|nr:hypothetical protein [Gimesia alba]QDT43161.1 LexA repressor [Gimesia alba]